MTRAIVMMSKDKSQSVKRWVARPSARLAYPILKVICLIKQTAFLGEITEEKTGGHGEQANTTQVNRRHFKDLPEPALHGFGKCHIGQTLKNKDQAYQGE